MKILFSTFNHWPGVVTCLNNMRNLIEANYPEANIRTHNFEGANLSFSMIKEIKFDPPDFLFLGGWDNNIRTIVQNASEKTKVILMWCSPITQIELGGEMGRFFDVWNFLSNRQIDFLGIPVETDYESLKLINNNVFYFPIYMNTNELDQNKINAEEEKDLCTDIFCAPCPRKNILAQIFALSHHDVKLKLNYNRNNMDLSYVDVAHNLLKKYENLGWLNREEYLKEIQKVDFGMQVSLSESFNYVAAEHMYYGVPVIISKALPYSSDERIKELVVDDHQNVYEISRSIGRLCSLKGFREEMSEKCKKTISEYNLDAKERLSISLESILKG